MKIFFKKPEEVEFKAKNQGVGNRTHKNSHHLYITVKALNNIILKSIIY